MTPTSRPFPALLVLLAVAFAFLPGITRACAPCDAADSPAIVVGKNVDQDTAACVKRLIPIGTTAADLLAKGFHQDRVTKNADGSVTYLYRRIHYVIERGIPGGLEIPVRYMDRLGDDLKVTLVDHRVVSWRLGT